ncbi:hypothetical protein MLE29_10710 [Pasteurella multocida]|uniref:hypothetical protein n=1 Tax=Pasteurella multocida TaxID=747 RepID=UPI001F117297|nr:hypothetical protein [Pasteurella multocida]MCH4805145.1 hypothetical protein [Pasteurella multocida]
MAKLVVVGALAYSRDSLIVGAQVAAADISVILIEVDDGDDTQGHTHHQDQRNSGDKYLSVHFFFKRFLLLISSPIIA